MAQPIPDIINHPAHYTATAIEPIDVIEAWDLGFHLGAVVKYVARAPHKGRYLEDLRKARWFLDRHIANTERNEQERVLATLQAEIADKYLPTPDGGTGDEEPYADVVKAAKSAFNTLFRVNAPGHEG